MDGSGLLKGPCIGTVSTLQSKVGMNPNIDYLPPSQIYDGPNAGFFGKKTNERKS